MPSVLSTSLMKFRHLTDPKQNEQTEIQDLPYALELVYLVGPREFATILFELLPGDIQHKTTGSLSLSPPAGLKPIQNYLFF